MAERGKKGSGNNRMDIPDRLIIDIETKKGAFGFWVNNRKVDLVSGGKEIIHVSKNE